MGRIALNLEENKPKTNASKIVIKFQEPIKQNKKRQLEWD